MTYIARVSYMLQQGNAVADIAYLLPEGAPSTMPFWGCRTSTRATAGYDYDYINTDVLLHHTSVTADSGIHVDGNATGNASMAAGMTYRILVLPPTTQMTPEVAQKLHDLVAAGATIVGPRPTTSPSLTHGADADAGLHNLALEIWGDMDGVTLNQHSFGKGITYWGLSLDEILTRSKTPPDFVATAPVENAPVWIHRHMRTQRYISLPIKTMPLFI